MSCFLLFSAYVCCHVSLIPDVRDRLLNERRLSGLDSITPTNTAAKRPAIDIPASLAEMPTGKRPRGRPKGSKNKAKTAATTGSNGNGVDGR